MDEQTGKAKNASDSNQGKGNGENQSIAGEQERQSRRKSHRDHSRSPQPQSQQQGAAKSSLNMNELRELAGLINEHGFTDFEFENENIRVRLRKELAPQIIQAAAPMQMAAGSAPTQSNQTHSADTVTANPSPSTIDEDANFKKITSPIVGTFYRAPSPEAAPFVNIGSQVATETTVCIVEAMKLMNEIPAEISGEIVKIYVENGQPVEYGQALFAVK